MESPQLSSSAQRVQSELNEKGIPLRVQELRASMRTAEDAANAIGCAVGQIAKSLVFRGSESDQPVMIIASGANRVDVDRVAAVTGEPLRKADANYVRRQTGYAIGGVPPVAHAATLRIYVDRALLQYPEIWAAAGTPNAVFALTPGQLLELTGAEVISVE